MLRGGDSERVLAYRAHLREIATARLRVVCVVLGVVFIFDGGAEFLTRPDAFFADFWARAAALLTAAIVFFLVRRRPEHPRAFQLAGILAAATAVDIEAAVLTSGGQHSTFFMGFLLLIVAIGLLFPFDIIGELSICAIAWVAFFGPLIVGRPSVDLKLLADQVFFLACATLVAVVGTVVTSRLRKSEFWSREALREEKAISERLLLNVLPRPIADRLKNGAKAIADRFQDASVLFADIVGFTPLSERMPPEEMVALLNELFSAFDRTAEQFGLEKIKTIGDAYMIAAGLPEPRSDHLRALADMALEMQRTVAVLEERHHLGLALRIGIHCGPMVAGVIGATKFCYDVWGDTVNTASRMESHALPGRIQVTEEVRKRLQGEYIFSSSSRVEVKGKGGVLASFLLAKVPRPEVFAANRSAL